MPRPVRSLPLGKLAAILAGAALTGLVACGGSSSDGPLSILETRAVTVANLDGKGPGILSASALWTDGWPDPGLLSARLAIPAAPGTWLDPVRSTTGMSPVALATGDLDGDGRPDAVTAILSEGSGGLAIQLQSATTPGSFLAPQILSTGSRRPLDVALADLTGSGRLDLVVALDGASSILVYLHGTTPGTFQAPITLPVGGEPAAVVVADLTGSGQKDIAAATANGGVSILLHGTTPGTFQAFVPYASGADPVALKAADLDGDGHLDLLVANYDNGTQGLSLLRQDPASAGSFLAAVNVDTGDYGSASLDVADLDGDGHLDVVVANAGLPGWPGSVAVFRQDPAHPGVLLAPDFYRGYYGPLSIAIADLKGDGHPALVIADGTPCVRFQDPARPGAFQPPTWLKY